MKPTRSAKLFTGLALMAGLFLGCQDLLSQKDGSAKEPEVVTTDESALRLSIKDDSTCRDQWNVILDARAGGFADSAAEKSFLANCVKEVRVDKDMTPPVIPPHLLPDSASRCHWIVAQIEGGRDEMTVSYKRYCPEDCRKLEDKDSTRHIRLCRDPHDPGVDTVKPPIDTVRPPKDPLEDSCKLFRARLAGLDTASQEYQSLRRYLLARCDVVKPPIDTVKPPLPRDTVPKPPINNCETIMRKLMSVPVGGPDYMHLKEMYGRECAVPRDTVDHPPIIKDSIPVKPETPVVNCDELRAKLLKLDPASADYKRLSLSIPELCAETKPVVK